jgi:hypothetical protein
MVLKLYGHAKVKTPPTTEGGAKPAGGIEIWEGTYTTTEENWSLNKDHVGKPFPTVVWLQRLEGDSACILFWIRFEQDENPKPGEKEKFDAMVRKTLSDRGITEPPPQLSVPDELPVHFSGGRFAGEDAPRNSGSLGTVTRTWEFEVKGDAMTGHIQKMANREVLTRTEFVLRRKK